MKQIGENKVLKYVFELVVIIVGISISFLIEYKREINHKNSLKSQSLERIINNIKIDNDDYDFNLNAHKEAIKAIDWLNENYKNFKAHNNDTIGKYIQLAMFTSTTFYDNQEEYRTLQNSGLIEFIDNQEIVIGLQNKYLNHEYMKHLEDEIDKYVFNLKEYRFNNVILNSNDTNVRGYPTDAKYVGNNNFPVKIIQALLDKRWWHNLYLNRINVLIESDKVLVDKINTEIK